MPGIAGTAAILCVVLTYAAFAAAWIVLSDQVLAWMLPAPEHFQPASTLKGWLFVAVTSLLLYALMRRLLGRGGHPSRHPGLRSLAVPLALLGLALGALTAAGIGQVVAREKAQEARRLSAIADLKGQQIEAWMGERHADVLLVQANRFWAELFHRWRVGGDTASRDLLLERLEGLRSAGELQAVELRDQDGGVVWRSEIASADLDAPFAVAVRDGSGTNGIRHVGPLRDAAGRLHLAFIATLPAVDGQPGPAVVLDYDPETKLYPVLRGWPLPSASGETFLYRQDGDEIELLGDLRHHPDPSLTLRLPRTGHGLAAQVARGDAATGTVLESDDYRHVAILGIVRAVRGTDWFLVAKVDRAEAYADLISESLWVALVGVLALLVAATGVVALRQRHDLAASQRARAIQAEKLSALQLLDAIADASADAIMAKDVEGRYTLFNREAARVTGRNPADVLGRDDSAVFGADDAAKLMASDRQVLAEDRIVAVEQTLDTVDGPRTFHTTKGPLRDADGKTFGVYGVARDITERKRMEDALRESERTYRSLFENMRSGFAHCRMIYENGEPADFVYLSVNRAFEALTGFHDVVGKRVSDFVPGIRESDPEFIAMSGRVARTGQTEHAEIYLSSLQMWVARTVYSPRPDHFVTVFDVVTERKRAEQRLRDSEASLARAQAIAQLGNWRLDLVTGEVIASDEAYRILNVPPGAPMSFERFRGHVVAEDQARVLAAKAASLAGASCDIEHRILVDGKTRWVRVKGDVTRFAEGRPVSAFGTIQDITERKQRESKLRESEQKLRLFIENAPAAIAMLDRDMRYLSVSRRWLHDCGLGERDVVGRCHYELFPEVPERWKAIHQRCLAGATERCDEDSFPRADGSLDWVKWEIRPWRGADGAVGGIIMMSELVTERKVAEEQVRKLSLAVEQSPESIVITDLRANIEYVNEAFVQVTGYTREEVIGKNPRLLASGRTPPEAYPGMWNSLLRGQPWKGQFINRRKDGSEYVEFAHVAPIREPDGRITHYVAVKEDISEKMRIAAELDRYRLHLEELVDERTRQLADAMKRAEDANLAKSTFLANMSHEIRTPMNAIVGLAHLMQRQGVAADQAERLRKIDGAAHHLLSIISDVLDVSKIEAGRLELEETDFGLHELLDNVRSLIAEDARARGLVVAIDVDPGLPALSGDVTRLRQAVLNYASNAVKFTERGSIVLRARIVEEDGDAVVLRFEVQDSGIGIRAENMPLLFEPFEQVDKSTTRRYGGTGLGLAITRRLALLMGGNAGFASEPGRGSTFWFTARVGRGTAIPPAAAPPATRELEDLIRRRHAGARVLLAEDNAVNLEVALELLQAVGLVVETASDGCEAVAKARAAAYDLILMDTQMPVLDGLQATAAIREIPGRDAVPILAVTANVFAADRIACAEAGMNAFVGKPVDPPVLYQALLDWLPDRSGDAPAPDAPAEAQMGDQALRERIFGITGLDAARGLAAVHGNASRYARLLALFAARHAGDAAQLREHAAQGDFEAIARAAHALKGAAASIGAGPVRDAAGVLEAAVRQPAAPEVIGRSVAALDAALQPLVAALRRVTVVVARGDEPADPRRLAAVLRDLRVLLDEGDIAATDLAHEEGDLVRATLGAAGVDLLRRISAYDYEGAGAVLRAAAEDTQLAD